MSKYIIELKPEYEDSFKGVMILGAKDSNLFVDTLAVENLEELNSDYINENFGELQDEAYQAGLNDAWEAAKKLFSSMADSDIEKAFPIEWNNGGFKALMNLQPQEAIAKLKDYEDKRSDRIEVGDEVATETGKKYTVVSFGDSGTVCGFNTEGRWTGWNPKEVTKTGKHYDIQSILGAMKS